MHLIQILLPLYDNEGQPFTQDEFLKIRDELSERFGGITTYMRSPARGLWKETKETTVQDDIVIYEVMTETLDRAWWTKYRKQLTAAFRQALLIVRVSEVELL
ncbi:hypothetical protein E4633_12320 [Geomonas terrae]|uniref:DUF1330 domain-containing protein n=1 Tax=Geomonas terrae TaxID=2562681 RepID=A0A4S1CCK7_9BACT|nr:hypothetical protein [Geomonas terrae]TGU71128.1 hypothetical protein E4633_12320 [Geomonas terrae]